MVKGAAAIGFGALATALIVARMGTLNGEQALAVAADAPSGASARVAAIAADARGQFGADMFVDDVPVHMLVDTGATLVVLSAATASRLGLAGRAGEKWTIRTANGDTQASPVTLASVKFGGLDLRDVQALVLAPGGGDLDLLGVNFLGRLASVEQRGGVMVLRQ